MKEPTVQELKKALIDASGCFGTRGDNVWLRELRRQKKSAFGRSEHELLQTIDKWLEANPLLHIHDEQGWTPD